MNMTAYDEERVLNEQEVALGGQERVEMSRGHCVAMKKQRNWKESSSLKPCLKF